MINLVHSYLKTVWHHGAALNNEILASYIEPGKQAIILDIGCDEGSKILERVRGKIKHPKIYGIDINPEKIKRAKKLGIIAIKSNVEKPLPFNNNFFDIVSANQIIEHLVDVDQFVKEIYRILKPGGYLILATENLSSWHNIFALLLGWRPFSQQISTLKNIGNPMRLSEYTENYRPIDQHIKIFTPRSLKELVKLHGLTIEQFFGAGYYPFSSFISRVLSNLDPVHTAFIGLKAKKLTTKN